MFKNIKIKTKISLSLLILSIIPVVVITGVMYFSTRAQLLDSALDEEMHDVMMKKNNILNVLDDVENELSFLSRLDSLYSFINDDEDGNLEMYKGMLSRDFLAFAEERTDYYQVRYIDENGQEIIRVDNDGQNIFLVSEDKLQNKKGRYYFEDTMSAKQGTIFVSPLDLNIENGQIENRGTEAEPMYVPVIRYGTPLFDDQDQRRGVLIFNVYAEAFLSKLDKTQSGAILGKETFLINKDGYFLHNPDTSKEWGFLLENDETIWNHCDQAERFFEEEEGQFYSEKTDCFLTFERIYPSGSDSLSSTGSNQAYASSVEKVQGDDYFWILVNRVQSDAIFGDINKVLFKSFIILIILLFAVILLSLIIASSISGPIKKLIKDIPYIKTGNLDYKLNTEGSDEIGELSRTFDKLTQDIKKSREGVDKKVKIQTKEIVSKGQALEAQQSAVLNILEDVEEEKEKSEDLAKDLEKFKLAVDNASDHVVITDADGILIYGNKGMEEITGYTIKEILGTKVGTKKNWGGNMPKDFYDKLWRTVKVEKKIFEGDIKNKRKNGEEYDAFASISPILDNQGNVKFFVGIERDVSKERQIDRAKSEFVSLASHQLRTPLSTISWYAEMLLAEDAGKLNKEQKEYTGEIYKGNQRMVDLVNALLNVSRIELGTLAVDPKPTNLIDQAESVLNEIKPLIAKKKLKVVKKFGKAIPEINLDDKLMRIVWQNLLSNSLKYTPDKGQIGVSITKDKVNVKIEVSDTGMGIPKAQQKNIFTKLFRADNVREKETDGTGLGLYIVKSVIKQFGGEVWFKSVENKGTTFYATIPLKGIKSKEGTRGLEYTK
ncbi:PAS domain S-box protein [Candidatus Parcubacteria bacterium]|nr:PAS domain S-box protein [Candidatus Parcubacteria bacterium]